MGLQNKTILIVSLTFISLFVVLLLVSQLIFMSSYSDLENRDIRTNTQRFISALSDEIHALDTLNYDWSAWNDTHEFIQDHNEDYIEANLPDETFYGLDLNLMLFLDNDAQIVYSKVIDLENEEEVPLLQGLEQHLLSGGLLSHHENIESSIHGLLILSNHDPIMITSRPIITSENKGPINGTLIMGRFLNEPQLEDLMLLTHLSVEMQFIDDEQMPDDFSQALSGLSEDESIFIQTLSDDSIAGYALQDDIYGQAGLVFRVDVPRDIYNQGKTTSRYFLVSLLLIGVVFAVTISVLLQKSVLSRLFKFGERVNNIGKSKDFSGRLSDSSNDELTDLAKDINKMLTALEKSHLEIERSNKELEQFAYVISHDLKEPLSMINGYLKLLEQRVEKSINDETKEYIVNIKNGTKLMREMINDLLNYAHVDSRGKPLVPTQPDMALKTALTNLEHVIEENGAIITTDSLPVVKADEIQLVQLFQNLISNAIKFRGEDPPRIHVTAIEKDNELVFSVRDNGIGIDPQFADRIFMIFQRVPHEIELPGTGIGLSICQKVVQRHGGRIWVESEIGKGSTFFFTLPKAKAVDKEVEVNAY